MYCDPSAAGKNVNHRFTSPSVGPAHLSDLVLLALCRNTAIQAWPRLLALLAYHDLGSRGGSAPQAFGMLFAIVPTLS